MDRLSLSFSEQLVFRLQPILECRAVDATARLVDFVRPSLNDLDIDAGLGVILIWATSLCHD
jgi:hypothetical protein